MPAPFGASAEGVRDLVLDVAVEGQRVASRTQRVGDAQIETWLDEAAARVNLRVAGYEVAGSAFEEHVEILARHLVQLYAAALMWDATHPERGGGMGGGGGRLSDSLMLRYREGADELAAFLGRVLGGGAGGSDLPPPAGVQREVGAEAYFPAAEFRKGTRW